MAIITKGENNQKRGLQSIVKDSEKVNFRIVDTEFLMRLILGSSIEGKDVDVASRVLKKIRKMHEILVSKTYEAL